MSREYFINHNSLKISKTYGQKAFLLCKSSQNNDITHEINFPLGGEYSINNNSTQKSNIHEPKDFYYQNHLKLTCHARLIYDLIPYG